METLNELNERILGLTLRIQEETPELSPFLDEMPVTIPNKENPNMDYKILKEYYESLAILLKEYLVNKKLAQIPILKS